MVWLGLTFMLVLVPATALVPVDGKLYVEDPLATSNMACSMVRARFPSRTPRTAFTLAAAHMTEPSAQINECMLPTGRPLTGKFSTASRLLIHQYVLEGTARSPNESCSRRAGCKL